ncbi:MAG: hypothetical protein ACK4RK_16360 [Gemmataceae bacterium]
MRNILGVLVLGVGTLGCGLATPHSSAQADDNKGTVVELDALRSKAPASWKSEPTNSQFRVYQFQIPRVKGDPADAELVIFYFGEGGGGGVEANIDRWQKMFEPPAGKKIDEVSTLDKMKAGDVNIIFLDVQGTYLERFPPFAPNAKITRKPDYRMFGVIFDSPKGPYYMRLVGPAKTVAENKKAFEDWLKAFK